MNLGVEFIHELGFNMYQHIHTHGHVGSGKTTLIRCVAERLQQLGYSPLLAEEHTRWGPRPNDVIMTVAISPGCALAFTEGSQPDEYAEANLCIPQDLGDPYRNKDRLLALALPAVDECLARLARESAGHLEAVLPTAPNTGSHPRF
jgi:hypothetical protein